MSDCPSVRPFHMSRSNLRTPWPIHFKFHRVIGIDGLVVCILYCEISIFHMSHCELRTPWPIHFKLRTGIEIDSLTVCILFGEISIFHSRVMGLYSSNCRRFFMSRCKLRTIWQTFWNLFSFCWTYIGPAPRNFLLYPLNFCRTYIFYLKLF